MGRVLAQLVGPGLAPCMVAETDGNFCSGLDDQLAVEERRPSEFLTESDLERNVSIGMVSVSGVCTV